MRGEAAKLAIQEKDGSLTFSVRVMPRAKKDEIVGVEVGSLKVRIAAPAVRGKANGALVELLAQALGVRKQQVEIASGQRARNKIIKIRDLAGEEARKRLGNFTSS